MLRTTDTWFVSVVGPGIVRVGKSLPWDGRRSTGTWRADLGELSDNALLARLRPLPPDSAERAAICEVLVERYAHLVRACVRPYRASPEPTEDLTQVGYLG